jgi:hypothetical protein
VPGPDQADQIGDGDLFTATVNWVEVTAIATSTLAIGLLGGVGAENAHF